MQVQKFSGWFRDVQIAFRVHFIVCLPVRALGGLMNVIGNFLFVLFLLLATIVDFLIRCR